MSQQNANSFQLERPLVGFRTWYTRPLVPQTTLFGAGIMGAYNPKPLALYPMTSEIPWTHGINEAVCSKEGRHALLKEEHTSPHADCSCGMHAYINHEHDEESKWITHLFDKELTVQGAILMWGQIFSGSKVIRSQYAEIVALLDDSIIAKEIAKRYNVPCVSEAHMLYLATEYGDRVSPELEKAIKQHTEASKVDASKDFPQTT